MSLWCVGVLSHKYFNVLPVGRLVVRPAPEALAVSALFDPASPNVLDQILRGEVRCHYISSGSLRL